MTKYIVTHENEEKYVTDSADAAWKYIHRAQGQSVDFAVNSNGWSIDVEHMAYVGRTSEGERIWVEIRISTEWANRDGSGYATIKHAKTPRRTRISITGMGVWKGCRTVDFVGQITETVADLTKVNRDRKGSSWTAKDVRSLVDIWDRWHLNDLRAGCAHMNLPEDKSYDARSHIICTDKSGGYPDKPYKYGSAWLYEEPPAEVLDELMRLIDLPAGNIPDYVR